MKKFTQEDSEPNTLNAQFVHLTVVRSMAQKNRNTKSIGIGKMNNKTKESPFYVGLVVINSASGEVLLGKRLEDGIYTGPGGSGNQGETPKQAIIREAFEEAGLELIPEALTELPTLTAGNGKQIFTFLYVIPPTICHHDMNVVPAGILNRPKTFPNLDPDCEVAEWLWIKPEEFKPEMKKDGNRHQTILNGLMKFKGLVKSKTMKKAMSEINADLQIEELNDLLKATTKPDKKKEDAKHSKFVDSSEDVKKFVLDNFPEFSGIQLQVSGNTVQVNPENSVNTDEINEKLKEIGYKPTAELNQDGKLSIKITPSKKPDNHWSDKTNQKNFKDQTFEHPISGKKYYPKSYDYDQDRFHVHEEGDESKKEHFLSRNVNYIVGDKNQKDPVKKSEIDDLINLLKSRQE